MAEAETNKTDNATPATEGAKAAVAGTVADLKQLLTDEEPYFKSGRGHPTSRRVLKGVETMSEKIINNGTMDPAALTAFDTELKNQAEGFRNIEPSNERAKIADKLEAIGKKLHDGLDKPAAAQQPAPVKPQTPPQPQPQPVAPKAQELQQADDETISITRSQGSDILNAFTKAGSRLAGIDDYVFFTRGGKIFDGYLDSAQKESTKVLTEKPDGSFTFNKDAYRRMVIDYAAVKGSAKEIEYQSLATNQLTPKQQAVLDSLKPQVQKARPTIQMRKKVGSGSSPKNQPKMVNTAPELLNAKEEVILPQSMTSPAAGYADKALDDLTSASVFGFLGPDGVNKGEIIAGTMLGAVTTSGVYAPQTAVEGLQKAAMDQLNSPQTPHVARAGRGKRNKQNQDQNQNAVRTGADFSAAIFRAEDAINRALENNGTADSVDKKFLSDRLGNIMTTVTDHMTGLSKNTELKKLEQPRADGITGEMRELIGQVGNLPAPATPVNPGEIKDKGK